MPNGIVCLIWIWLFLRCYLLLACSLPPSLLTPSVHWHTVHIHKYPPKIQNHTRHNYTNIEYVYLLGWLNVVEYAPTTPPPPEC